MTRSKIVARHVKKREEGFFSTPRHELYEVCKLLEEGELTRTEKAWAYRRRQVLIRQLYNPSLRFLVHGAKPGKTPTKTVTPEQEEETVFREKVLAIKDVLDKP